MRKTSRLLPATLMVSAAGLLAAPRAAHACGGFFCSQVPVDQAGEQILFSLRPDGVTAYVQIAYAGAAEDFSWVVPVMSLPRISIGTQELFAQLNGTTAPQFTIDWGMLESGRCGIRVFDEASAPNAAGGGDGGVKVLDEGEVGPFNYKVLESKDPDALTRWLQENKYDQPDAAIPLIKHYVDAGMLFVAVKLKKDAMVGEIQPLVLDMDHSEACVPLILTRIAAVPDMPVLTYVLGNGRAVPRNWFHVEPDYAQVNFLDGGSNYRRLAADAINEAAGHGFITEFSGAASVMKDKLWREGRYDLAKLRTITDPAQMIQTLLQMGFPRDATMQALLRTHIPMPASLVQQGVEERQFYNNLRQYADALMTEGFVFDPVAFVAALEERIVKPMQEAQALFAEGLTLTRMLSLVSPDEMTRDPLFHLNPDLPPVSNLHKAIAMGTCQEDGRVGNLRLLLETGETVGFDKPLYPWEQATWPLAGRVQKAKRIALVGANGQPTYVKRADISLIDQMLDRQPAEMVRPKIVPDPTQIPGPGGSDPGTVAKDGGGGCAMGGGAGVSGALALLLGLAGLLGIARRRG